MEKRNFYRLHFSLVFDFVILNPKTIEAISIPMLGTLKDLSGGGISFTSKESLEAEQLLEIKISNQDKLILVLGKVIRKQEQDQINLYVAEFVYIDQNTQDKLVQMIYSIQMKERAMKKLGGGTNGYE